MCTGARARTYTYMIYIYIYIYIYMYGEKTCAQYFYKNHIKILYIYIYIYMLPRCCNIKLYRYWKCEQHGSSLHCGNNNNNNNNTFPLVWSNKSTFWLIVSLYGVWMCLFLDGNVSGCRGLVNPDSRCCDGIRKYFYLDVCRPYIRLYGMRIGLYVW